MPKLSHLQVKERVEGYIKRMRAAEEVAIRDIKIMLTLVDETLIAWMDEQWAQQQVLRKTKPAKTEAQKLAYGYQTKRDIQLSALLKAHETLNQNSLENLERELAEKNHRQARIFMDGYAAARQDDKDQDSALAYANNQLTRAKLPRVDGAKVDTPSQRDLDVWSAEESLLARFREQMTDDEREQQELLVNATAEAKKITSKHSKSRQMTPRSTKNQKNLGK